MGWSSFMENEEKFILICVGLMEALAIGFFAWALYKIALM